MMGMGRGVIEVAAGVGVMIVGVGVRVVAGVGVMIVGIDGGLGVLVIGVEGA